MPNPDAVIRPSEVALTALQLNQVRIDFQKTIQQAETLEDVGAAVIRTDRQIRALAQALERFAVRLATGKPKRQRGQRSVRPFSTSGDITK